MTSCRFITRAAPGSHFAEAWCEVHNMQPMHTSGLCPIGQIEAARDAAIMQILSIREAEIMRALEIDREVKVGCNLSDHDGFCYDHKSFACEKRKDPALNSQLVYDKKTRTIVKRKDPTPMPSYSFKKIYMYSMDELTAAIEAAVSHCNEQKLDFYKILNGIDAYLERRSRRERTDAAGAAKETPRNPNRS